MLFLHQNAFQFGVSVLHKGHKDCLGDRCLRDEKSYERYVVLKWAFLSTIQNMKLYVIGWH